jgi:uncharacterized membrane protein
MVVAGLAWAVTSRAPVQVLVYAMLAAFVSMVTPIVRAAAWLDRLPVWIQWYLRPAGEYTTFTLLPWAGFVLAGAAVGVMVVAARDDGTVKRLSRAIGIAGAVLLFIGYTTAFRPSIYSVPSAFWTSSPTWFAMRTGLMMLTFALLAAIPERRGWALSWQAPLGTLGRASLFVYWIHVELVYGYASWLWRHRLPVWGSVVACILFTALMYGTVVVRNRFVARRQRPATFRRPATLSEA